MTSIMMIDIAACRGFPFPARRVIDPRWPAVAAALAHLRAARRRSVRIVDAECGDGRLLIHAARHARALGFTAIEARGIDDDRIAVAAACAAAARVRNPAIGLVFELADLPQALAEEAEFPADLIVWHGGAGARPDIAAAVEAAGHLAIGGPRARHRVAA